MKKVARNNITALPLVFSILLPSIIAIAMLLKSAGAALAQEPLTFTIPHEIQLSAMLVIDLDGDGKKEIITGAMDGYLTVVDGATYNIIWDKNLGDYLRPNYERTHIQSGLAAADINNDDALDIVIATGGADPIDEGGPGAIVVLTYVGGSKLFELMPGWPRFALDELGNGSQPDGHPDGFVSTPALGDIDGDGDMEIVIGGMDRRLHAYQHTGADFPGWPLGRDYNIWRESRSSPALADLDNDGALEIMIGSNNYPIPFCANPYLFYAMKGNSTPLPGFPYQTTQNIDSSPAIGDINNDGSLDIIFGTGGFNESCRGNKPEGNKIYALDRFGQPIPGWPVATNANMINSPALGDLDNDGQPEVVLHTQKTLYAFHGDGTIVQGFPVQGDYNYNSASPVMADVDGDSKVEIVLASGQVYDPDGTLIVKRNWLQSKLVVTDQDGDGLFETIGANHYNYDKGWHLRVYIFQETGSAAGAKPWPTFHRSDDRTGVLPSLFALSGRIVDESNTGVPGVQVKLDDGQSTLTDDLGEYSFGNMPPGRYTLTPDYQPNRFKPDQRSIVVNANTTVADIVMHDPLYDIQGRVQQANNAPLAGVNVKLNSGVSVTTDGNGTFSFKDQEIGEYTLSPVSPEYSYLPSQRTLKVEDEEPQLFYALPQPVTAPLDPSNPTEVVFMDTQDLPTRIALQQEPNGGKVVVTPLLPEPPPGYWSAGHAFDISLEIDGASTSSSSEVNQTPLVSVEIQYSQADLRSIIDVEELTLFWKSPEGWIEAQTACPAGSTVDHNLALRKITVPICNEGTYALLGPVDQLYMPSVNNQ